MTAGGGWDVHTHLVPPALLSAPGVDVRDGTLVVDGRATVPVGQLSVPAALAGWVRAQRLAGALVSLPPMLLRYHLPGDDAFAWSALANQALADAAMGVNQASTGAATDADQASTDPAPDAGPALPDAAADIDQASTGAAPDAGPAMTGAAADAGPALTGAAAGLVELRPLATVPLAVPDAAAREAAAALDSGRFGGLVLGTLSGTAAGHADPALDPLWRALDDRSAFVLVHPGDCPDPRLARYYLGNLLGNPYETTLATAQLLFGGVLARYPGITFCLAHGGGFTAAAAGRWQRGVDTGRPGVPAGAGPVRPLLRRLLVDDLVHDHDAVRLLEATFGADRVVVGSDWPFPMGTGRVDPDRARATAALVEPLTRPRPGALP